jgi:Fe-S-cluster containining protein
LSKLFLSAERGFHYTQFSCFRCGDCCSRIPVEVSQQEIDRIKRSLKDDKSKLFIESLTTDPKVADPFEPILPLSSKGVAWIRMPCLFVDYELVEGKRRSVCRIYAIRPEICRLFHCGKQSVDDALRTQRYKYLMTPSFKKYLKHSLIKESGKQAWEETKKRIKEAEKTRVEKL